MSDMAEVVSLADRLKQRRKELGMSQAQAARELDVARTAYRLWEMEAAKPQPDRWRLISRWLGVSVTTMLLSDEDDGFETATDAFDRVGRDWEETITSPSEYFARAQHLIQEGAEKGFLGTEDAEDLLATFKEIERRQAGDASELWEPAKLYKELASDTTSPKAARDAIDFIAGDVPQESLYAARLLASELVTNSVIHGPGPNARIGLQIEVTRNRLRVEVSDTAEGSPKQTAPSDTGGYGLTLVDQFSDRWATTRTEAGNLTWSELDLPEPGAKPERR